MSGSKNAGQIQVGLFQAQSGQVGPGRVGWFEQKIVEFFYYGEYLTRIYQQIKQK